VRFHPARILITSRPEGPISVSGLPKVRSSSTRLMVQALLSAGL